MVPPVLWHFRAEARRRAAGVGLVHAHWLPTGLVAAGVGKPFVLQLWGTDVELARRASALARRVVRKARLVICPSQALASAARELGARDGPVIPSGGQGPAKVPEASHPPEVPFAGRP